MYFATQIGKMLNRPHVHDPKPMPNQALAMVGERWTDKEPLMCTLCGQVIFRSKNDVKRLRG